MGDNPKLQLAKDRAQPRHRAGETLAQKPQPQTPQPAQRLQVILLQTGEDLASKSP
jgi:hypothetical protein